MDENSIGRVVVDAAISVHREVGPGLLETVYELVLLDELQNRGLDAKRQVPIPIHIRGIHFDEAFRADIIVENKVILELKCVEKTGLAHKKATFDLFKAQRNETRVSIKFCRSDDEGRHYSDRKWAA